MTTVVLTEFADRPYPHATIDTLPDNVLLEIFEFYLGQDNPDRVGYYGQSYDGWQTLVHVCHRWRCVVFASPRRLDLKLYCTRNRLFKSKTLDIWPALPIAIFAEKMRCKEDVTNVITALRHHNRVCKIFYHNARSQDSLLLKEFAAIDEPFVALTCLELRSLKRDVPVLPDSFLGGSAPRLRSLRLVGIPYPSIGNLLSSTTNLVRLSLRHIPHSGYIPPETIVHCLSMLPRLKSLLIGFQHPRSRAHRASRHPPPLTRAVCPNLTYFAFHGDSEYLEDILSHLETPMLNQSRFRFFNQLIFDTPLLGHFIRRTGTFMKIHSARVEFSSWLARFILSGREEIAGSDSEALQLEISCGPLDWQLSAMAQVLSSFLSSLPTLESLSITVSRKDWPGEIEGIQWREFLHSFTFVKDVSLVGEDSVRLVAPALQELAGERVEEVLPALQNLFFSRLRGKAWMPSQAVEEAIEDFTITRRLHGHPLSLHNWGTKYMPRTYAQ